MPSSTKTPSRSASDGLKPRGTVAVLGGTRFIGYHVVEALLRSGRDVWLFHRGRTREPRAFSRPVGRVHGDRLERPALERLFSRPYDAVVDLSGYTRPEVELALAASRGRIGQYVFCSTSSVYSVPPPVPFTEAAPVRSSDDYGGRKAAAESALNAISESTGLPVTIFRPQAVFGPFGAGIFAYTWQRLGGGRALALRPRTLGKRLSFLAVQDFAAATVAAIGNPRAFGKTFNLAGDEALTPETFLDRLERRAGAPAIRVTLEPRIARLFRGVGLDWLDHDLVPTNRPAKEALGLTFTPFDEAAELLWKWTLENPERPSLRERARERLALAANGLLRSGTI